MSRPKPTEPTKSIPTAVYEGMERARPKVSIGLVANMFVRMMHFEAAGDYEAGHTHAFDHLTLLGAGSLRVIINGTVTDYKAPAMIYIKAEVQHELVSLEHDTVAYCIHGLRDTNVSEDIISPDMLPNNPIDCYNEQKRLSKLVLGEANV